MQSNASPRSILYIEGVLADLLGLVACDLFHPLAAIISPRLV